MSVDSVSKLPLQQDRINLSFKITTSVNDYETKYMMESLDSFKLDANTPCGLRLNLFILNKILKGT